MYFRTLLILFALSALVWCLYLAVKQGRKERDRDLQRIEEEELWYEENKDDLI